MYISYITSKRRMFINDKLGIKARETAVVYLKVLSIHFNGGIEEHHKTIS
jgi:hypothetical protein